MKIEVGDVVRIVNRDGYDFANIMCALDDIRGVVIATSDTDDYRYQGADVLLFDSNTGKLLILGGRIGPWIFHSSALQRVKRGSFKRHDFSREIWKGLIDGSYDKARMEGGKDE